MGKKVIVWSGITFFVLTLAIAGCERGEREEGDEREHKEEAAPPSSSSLPGAVAPAPSGARQALEPLAVKPRRLTKKKREENPSKATTLHSAFSG